MKSRYQSVGRTGVACMALASLPVVVASCSAHDSGEPGPGDSVLTAGTSRVVASSLGGGERLAIPAGAPCHLPYSFDLALAQGDLTWSFCRLQGGDYRDPASYAVDSGTRTLTANERAEVVALIQAVKVSDLDTCGEDLDNRKMEVTSGGSTTTYGDDFNACQKMYDRYVLTERLGNLLDKYLALSTLPAN